MEYGKTCIEIVSIPEGDAPGEILEKWIGLRLPLETNEECFGFARGVVTHTPSTVVGYAVDAIMAIAILELHHPEAALWWRENTEIAHVGGGLIFNKDACRVVEGLPSFTFPTEQKGMVSVGGFFRHLSDANPGVMAALVPLVTRYANFWKELSGQVLTLPMILAFARIVASDVRKRLDLCASESTFTRLHREGHAVLQKLAEAAQVCGVPVDQEMVDMPITFTDIAVRLGDVEITPEGNVRLTKEGEEKIVREMRRESAPNN